MTFSPIYWRLKNPWFFGLCISAINRPILGRFLSNTPFWNWRDLTELFWGHSGCFEDFGVRRSQAEQDKEKFAPIFSPYFWPFLIKMGTSPNFLCPTELPYKKWADLAQKWSIYGKFFILGYRREMEKKLSMLLIFLVENPVSIWMLGGLEKKMDPVGPKMAEIQPLPP